jgi:TBC1 domain family protein 5
MHELLAPLLWLVDFDSLQSNGDETSLPHITLARDFVEHDTWALFSALMKSAKVYYDHSASVTSASKSSTIFPPPAPSSSSPPLVQPVVAIASHIHSTLRTLDPELHAAFARLQIEPQIYAIRWLRLLFSREFPLADTMHLWDALFARDPSLQLANHVCLAMLVRVRNSLLRAASEGYGEFIQVLLRYPACDDGKYRTPLLMQQALFLRDNSSISAAAYLVKQNIEAGAAIGEPVDTHDVAPSSWPAHQHASPTQRRNPGAVSPQGLGFLESGLVGDLAKGVYGRAEALGINKALRGTFDEIKVSIAILSQTYDQQSVLTASSMQRTMAEAQAQAEERRRLNAYSQIPTRPPWDPQRSPPPPPVVDKDTLADLASLRAASRAMSEAVDVCVAVLEKTLAPPAQPPPTAADPEKRDEAAAEASAAQMMALTALRHVRDVLGGEAPTFDASVLDPLKEMSRPARSNGPESHQRAASSSSSALEQATAPRARAAPTAARGPVDGLGAGFARLDLSPSPSPRVVAGQSVQYESPKSARADSTSYPPTASSQPALSTPSARPSAPVLEGSASQPSSPPPQPRASPRPVIPTPATTSSRAHSAATSHRDEIRRPFDPLGVL